MAPVHQHAKLLLRLLPRGREGDDALHQKDGDLEFALEPDRESSCLEALGNGQPRYPDSDRLVTLRTLGRRLPRPTARATTRHDLSR
jgi:hypothetical protein